ncbi:MAG: hypothetical protein KDB03_06595 [Planctomycetales bacterium]|nr:hypothetical protein [Planctomycetales bacterium]
MAKLGSAGRLLRRNLLMAASAIASLTGFTGCQTVHNGYVALTNNGAWNDTVIVLRNRNYSAKAWHRRKHHFCRQQNIRDFEAGFRAGYQSVAEGGTGCTPEFPPQDYWSWEFQSADGQSRTAAWFAGFPHGAQAAEEDGVGNWSQLQMSTGLQTQYQNAGVMTHEGALYPIPDNPPPGVPTSAGVPNQLPAGVQIVPFDPSMNNQSAMVQPALVIPPVPE